MGSAVLKIGHGNGHNERSLVDYVKAADCASFGCNEAQRLLPGLRGIPNHRVTVAGEDWTEEKNRARSTSIVTASKHASIGEFTRKVSERIPAAIRVAPDRVLVASFYEHPVARETGHEGVAHFELHPDAGPKQLNGRDGKAPIVREYRESLASTRLWMEAARHDGLLLVLTGDLQMTLRSRRPWSPKMMIAKPLRLHATAVNIDWIMYDRRLTLVGPLATRRLHDHTGFVATLKAR